MTLVALVARRLASGLGTLAVVSLCSFLLVHLVPGAPGEPAPGEVRALAPEELAAQRRLLGLDLPVLWNPTAPGLGVVTETRYARWVGRLARLDLGVSLRDGQPVGEKLARAAPRTLALSTLALALAYACAVPAGLWAAARAGRRRERALGVLLAALVALPSFWVALGLAVGLCGLGALDLFPLQGLASPGAERLPLGARALDLAWHLALPTLCLAYYAFAVLTRHQRGAALEALAQPFVRTARAKGLPERTVLARHVLRASAGPLVVLLGLELPALLSGSVVVERVFGIPGMDLLTLDALLARDYPTLCAVATLAAFLTVVGGLVADLLQRLVDPRARAGREGP